MSSEMTAFFAFLQHSKTDLVLFSDYTNWAWYRPGVNVMKTFSSSLIIQQNKLERVSMETFSGLSNV
jgi:hypothetical protein